MSPRTEPSGGLSRRAVLRGILGAAGAAQSDAVLGAASPPERLEIGGAILDVAVDSGPFDVGEPALLDWVRLSARAVSAYFGKFPVSHASILISAAPHGRVSNGVSFGDSGARCTISVGQNTTLADLHDDWVLTHEMVHFSFPSVERRHRWIEEGIATYVEPIARASIGGLPVERVWSDMIRDMHQGLPGEGDEGLDNTHTWGRTYWGGAIFCLLADIDIRKQTGNVMGLKDALRAINRAGGTIDVDWPLERALEIGDKATGCRSLTGLYRQMGPKTAPVDLPALWEQLGIRRLDSSLIIDDHAPLAAIRRAIVSPGEP